MRTINIDTCKNRMVATAFALLIFLANLASHTGSAAAIPTASVNAMVVPTPIQPGVATSQPATTQITPAGLNVWSTNGPEVETVRSLAIDPLNPITVYAGSAKGGLFKSTNNGASWSNTGLPFEFVDSVTIDPTNPNIIYATVSMDRDSALFKSVDGGASWSRADTGLPNGIILGAPVIDPNNSNTLHVGSSGMFKSTDGGASWVKTSSEIAGYILAIDPSNSNTVYASAISFAEGDFSSYLSKSTDGGVTWTGLDINDPSGFAIDPNNPDLLFVGAVSVSKSTDGGASWSDSSNGLPPGAFVGSLTIDRANANIIYAGTFPGGVFFKSSDAGASWEPLNNGLPNHSLNALVIDPSGTYLHAATDSGVFDYQVSANCDYSISPADEFFEAADGTGSINVNVGDECNWTAISYDYWISLTSNDSAGSGNGTVSYSVAANNSTLPRTATIIIAARSFTVTQAAAPLAITFVVVKKSKLFVFGEKFDDGAVVLLNGEAQRTKNDIQNPTARLICKGLGARIKSGDKLRVRNPDGALSPEFIFGGS